MLQGVLFQYYGFIEVNMARTRRRKIKRFLQVIVLPEGLPGSRTKLHGHCVTITTGEYPVWVHMGFLKQAEQWLISQETGKHNPKSRDRHIVTSIDEARQGSRFICEPLTQS